MRPVHLLLVATIISATGLATGIVRDDVGWVIAWSTTLLIAAGMFAIIRKEDQW